MYMLSPQYSVFTTDLWLSSLYSVMVFGLIPISLCTFPPIPMALFVTPWLSMTLGTSGAGGCAVWATIDRNFSFVAILRFPDIFLEFTIAKVSTSGECGDVFLPPVTSVGPDSKLCWWLPDQSHEVTSTVFMCLHSRRVGVKFAVTMVSSLFIVPLG